MELFTHQYLGYLASALIVVSLTMRSLLKLRMLNLVGAGTMALYGLFISAYPVVILNGLIVCIDIFYLREMFVKHDYFRLLEVRQNSKYLDYFLRFYADEIQRFLPDFSFRQSDNVMVYFVLRNLVPAGLVIAHRNNDCLFVEMDFVIPGYRDFKVGKFVYAPDSTLLTNAGIKIVYSKPGTQKHRDYLEKMGFQPFKSDAGEKLYRLQVARTP